jgi:hypothetical protein
MRTSLVLVLLLLEYPLPQPSNLRIHFFPAKKIRDKPRLSIAITSWHELQVLPVVMSSSQT